MENVQWLVMAVVAIVAVVATIYFGIQNLRNVITQRERDAGYASGRGEAKLENLEQLVRGVTEDVGVVNEKLDAHDVLLRQLRREAKRQSRRLRKLGKRVKVLEFNGPMPPTDPTSSEVRVESAPVNFEKPKLTVAGRGPSVEHGGAM